MKKAAITLILVLTMILVGVKATQVAEANFFPGDILKISSPISKMVYANTSIPLKIVAIIANPTPEVVSITYCLDGNHNVTLTDLSRTLREPGHIDGSDFTVELVLKNLVEGNHILEAYSQDAIGREMYASAEFFVDTSYPLTVLSPQNNRTYYSSEVPLNLVFREDGTYDGKFYEGSYEVYETPHAVVFGSFHDNLTLTGLSFGSHTIKVRVTTPTRLFYEETVYFIISEGQEPANSPNPYPELLVIASVVVAVVVGLGLLVYLIKRK